MVYALTSGPGQPESQSFQQAGVSEMVDLFTGDFKYNIPLMDIDGYPININYQSGSGIDDEASWVGLGWNLNVGSINRQVKGIPDDMAGGNAETGDLVETDHNVKPKVTVGGRFTGKVELRGNYQGNAKTGITQLSGPGVSGSLTFGLFSDNYTGMGAEFGANAGISFALSNDGYKTAGLGIGVLSNTTSGVDITPNISFSILEENKDKSIKSSSLSASFGYNSRSGMKSLGFGSTYRGFSLLGTNIEFNTEPITPKVQLPYFSTYSSLTLEAGLTIPLTFFGGGYTGYRNVRGVVPGPFKNPAIGFLYAEKGKNQPNAIMDFVREKENPVIPELPNLPLPVATPDVFSYNSQVGSGQFRLYRGGTGAFFDNATTDAAKIKTDGIDLGIGLGKHIGITLFRQKSYTNTGKWERDNEYLKKADFQDKPTTDLNQQHVFFKKTDERNIEDKAMSDKIFAQTPIAVLLDERTGVATSSFKSENALVSNVHPVSNPITKNNRQLQNTAISYLTTKEAALTGLDQNIKIYAFNQFGSFNPLTIPNPVPENRGNSYRKDHHISEITVTENSGQRAVYGLPVYNKTHTEYSFALGTGYTTSNGLVDIVDGIGNSKGIDHYRHIEKHPGYAYSYLLTGLLSADYVDRSNNGISPDDNGTAIKFKYSKLASDYGWRTPFNNRFGSGDSGPRRVAALNKGLLADPDDDKGSIVAGTKEIYYTHSIETKTKIAYFITTDREDALGGDGLTGLRVETVKQKCLKEIRLYSKYDSIRPIKVVTFDYGYELCPNTPNSKATEGTGGGKLTLKSIRFTYGGVQKSAQHPYVFSYNNTIIDPVTNTPKIVDYKSMATDRWGTYKPSSNNPYGMTNEEYPYADQVKGKADQAAALWQLKSITLPSGGVINVSYEADDYAYVQNKKATVMTPFIPLGPNSSSIENSDGIRVALDMAKPSSDTRSDTKWFKDEYLEGSDFIYTKSNIQIDPTNVAEKDFISAYCKVQLVVVANGFADITFEKVSEGGLNLNPIRHAALQKMKNEYPRYAYPGWKNRVGDSEDKSLKAIIAALGNAMGNLSDLKKNFYKRAVDDKHFATNITEKSFARLVKTSGKKIGGGLRVKKILINDGWSDFTSSGTTSTYGQVYDYTTVVDGKTISSGVAAYEPSIGNDENALKKPIPYIQRIKGALNNFFELEEPFGESFFPNPVVGYSKITVRDLENDQENVPSQTGFIVNEFYTAKEFPVIVDVVPIQRSKPSKGNFYAINYTSSYDALILSQGYSIRLNDMHGKPKANRIFNKSGAEISNAVYSYQVEDETAPVLKLKNEVSIVDQSGTVQTNKIMGRDIEMFTDFREQETVNSGTSINTGLDLMPVFPIPFPHWPVGANDEYKLYRSSSTVKVIKCSGIVNKVTKMENGSTIAVENVAYDGVTGEAIITKTQNEFKKDYYTVNLPAYWVYGNMGGAYKNLGMFLKVTLNGYNEVNSAYWDFLTEGDMLVNTSTGTRYWTALLRGHPNIGTPALPLYYSGYSKILIDDQGHMVTSINANSNTFQVIRSGYKNMMSASAGNVVSLVNPIKNGKIILTDGGNLGNYKIINANATVYDDVWPANGCGQLTERLENTTKMFKFKQGPWHSTYATAGTRFYLSDETLSYPYVVSNYLNNRLYYSRIWINEAVNDNNVNEWVGIKTTFVAPTTKAYYIGYAGDNMIKVKIDGVDVALANGIEADYWNVQEQYLTEGTHEIEVSGSNNSGYPYGISNNDTQNPGSFGLEIYNMDQSVLTSSAAFQSMDIIFTTASALTADGQANMQSYRSQGGQVWRFTYGNFYNPWVEGSKGNWRPSVQNVFQETRVYDQLFTVGKNGVNVRDAGIFKSFHSYWTANGFDNWSTNPAATKWLVANKITLYDKYGQELENKDALGRYSAANFDFNGLLPSAVANNARNREIYTNSFEDVKYKINQNADCPQVSFTSPNLYTYTKNLTSHTGNYSYHLTTEGLKLETQIHKEDHKTGSYFETNNGEFTLRNKLGLYPRGFEPYGEKTYIMNLWVKDDQPLNKLINISANYKGLDNVPHPITFSCKAIVEGWKLLEGKIPLNSSSGSSLTIFMNSGLGALYVDDIRIFPVDAHLKSFAYSDKTFKLMAELDENAFATFYEYDNEGSLIRVKKETERGIITLKENRSSLRKSNL